jgi:HK97 gp10 family phage protein
MSFTVDLSQLVVLQRDIRSFGEAVKDEVAMAGVAAGAKVIYDEARARAPVSEEVHIFYGRDSLRTGVTYTFAPGNLRDSIYRAYSPERSGPVRKEYSISWNHTQAPYGYMVEFGTSNASASPFLGPSLSMLPEAYTSAKVAMGAQLMTIQGRAL